MPEIVTDEGITFFPTSSGATEIELSDDYYAIYEKLTSIENQLKKIGYK